MTPSVLVVGAQRSGSTTLFRVLSEHPQLLRPTSVKGTGYFEDRYDRGPRWYRAHFPLRLTARRRERRLGLAPGTVRTFEISGYYLLHPLAAGRIARDLPDVHVVAMLRDPVQRAHSGWKHEHRRGFDDLDFADALEAEEERTAGESDRLAAAPAATSDALRHHAYLARGRYAEQLRRYVEALGPDRVHVVDADDFFAEPVPVLHRLEDALGLDRWEPANVPRSNATSTGGMDEAVGARLRSAYDAPDAELERLLGSTPSWRRGASSEAGRG